MKGDIKEKVRACLNQATFNEKDAIYFLVEAYKLLELEEALDDFTALEFYRNWAVHAKLSYNTEFKKNLEKIFRNVHLPEKEIPYEVFSFVYFDLLKKNIETFSEKFIGKGIRTGEFFGKFKGALIEVITDTPVHLTFEGQKAKLFFERDGKLVVEGPGPHRGSITVHGY